MIVSVNPGALLRLNLTSGNTSVIASFGTCDCRGRLSLYVSEYLCKYAANLRILLELVIRGIVSQLFFGR
jgi:hypothetical protein